VPVLVFRALRRKVAVNKSNTQMKAMIWSVDPNPSLPTRDWNMIGNTTPADHILSSGPWHGRRGRYGRKTPTAKRCARGDNTGGRCALLDEPLTGDYRNAQCWVSVYTTYAG